MRELVIMFLRIPILLKKRLPNGHMNPRGDNFLLHIPELSVLRF
jgi:hypothetical protein